jgi:hypothetical protein
VVNLLQKPLTYNGIFRLVARRGDPKDGFFDWSPGVATPLTDFSIETQGVASLQTYDSTKRRKALRLYRHMKCSR